MVDRCPHCKETTPIGTDVLFFHSAEGTHCLICGGRVNFNAQGRAIKFRAIKYAFRCIHDHKHRTQAAHDRCMDGASGAATGSRLALR